MEQTKKYILLISIIMMGFYDHSCGQNKESYSYRSELTVGLNTNPFLFVAYDAVELGPSISYSYRLNKEIEIGTTFFTRHQFISPRNEFGKANNINVLINRETVFTPHIGIVSGKKRIKNKFIAFSGFRHDLYKERLINSEYGINETFQYSEINFIFGLGYQFQYLINNGNGFSFRLLMPTSRNPLDDANRYSLEFGYTFALKSQKRSQTL